MEERDHLIQDIETSLATTTQYHNFANSLNIVLESHLSTTVQQKAPQLAAVASTILQHKHIDEKQTSKNLVQKNNTKQQVRSHCL